MGGEHLSFGITIALCSAIVAGVQFRAFGSGNIMNSPSNVASFFNAREILDRRQANLYSTMSLIPLTCVFIFMSASGWVFLEALAKPTHDVPLLVAITDWLKEFINFFGLKDPHPSQPISLLIFFLLISPKYSEFFFHRVERAILYISGVSDTINTLAEDTADVLLKGRGYKYVIERLEHERLNRVPFPRQLEDSNERKVLSFQLLYLARRNTARYGVERALRMLIAENIPEALHGRVARPERGFADSAGSARDEDDEVSFMRRLPDAARRRQDASDEESPEGVELEAGVEDEAVASAPGIGVGDGREVCDPDADETDRNVPDQGMAAVASEVGGLAADAGEAQVMVAGSEEPSVSGLGAMEVGSSWGKILAADSVFDATGRPRTRGGRIDWGFISLSAFMFLGICIVYVEVVPQVSLEMSMIGLTWPMLEYKLDLSWNIGIVCIATILPTLAGVVFVSKRLENSTEGKLRSFGGVLTQIFVFSFMVHLLNLLRIYSEVYIQVRDSDSNTYEHFIFQQAEFVYIAGHALVPCIAVLVVSLVAKRKADRERNALMVRGAILTLFRPPPITLLGVVLGVCVIGAGHAVAYVAYEIVADYRIHYYVHQALLATVLSLAALVMLYRYWNGGGRVR